MALVKAVRLECKFGGVSITRAKDRDTLSIGLSFSRRLLPPGKAVALFLGGPVGVLLKIEDQLFEPVEIKAVATVRGVGCRLTTYAVLLRLPVADVDVLDVAALAAKEGTLELANHGAT